MHDTHTTCRIADDVDVISYAHPVPGQGFLPIHSKGRALFSSDAFGAFVPEPFDVFPGQRDRDAALEGMSVFCRGNSPWLADVRPDRYETALKSLADLDASWLLSGHLPAVGAADIGRVIERAASFPSEGRIALPGQQALDAALAAMGRAA